jgi:hypothetical protein
VFAPPPTSQDITSPTEIVAALKQSAASINTYRVDVTGNTTFDDHNVPKSLFTSSIALVDLSLNRAYFDDAVVDTSVGGTLTQRTESYWMDDWVYSFKDPNISSGARSGVWYKYARPNRDAANFIFSTTVLLAAMENASTTVAASERVNGVECYKLNVGGNYPGYSLRKFSLCPTLTWSSGSPRPISGWSWFLPASAIQPTSVSWTPATPPLIPSSTR